MPLGSVTEPHWALYCLTFVLFFSCFIVLVMILVLSNLYIQLGVILTSLRSRVTQSSNWASQMSCTSVIPPFALVKNVYSPVILNSFWYTSVTCYLYCSNLLDPSWVCCILFCFVFLLYWLLGSVLKLPAGQLCFWQWQASWLCIPRMQNEISCGLPAPHLDTGHLPILLPGWVNLDFEVDTQEQGLNVLLNVPTC